MIRAYDKTYLACARTVLGRAFEYAVYDAHLDLRTFYDAFLSSPYAPQFERGDAGVVVGVSGVELARAVLLDAFPATRLAPARYAEGRSEQYWAGWALAYYQWDTALPFSEIDQAVPVERIVGLYHPYHEMDIRQFVDEMNGLYLGAFPDARLKRRRCAVGLTQRELSELTGVPLRTIQQYEQQQKDLGKAAGETLVRLAQVLCCAPIDLLDLVPRSMA